MRADDYLCSFQGFGALLPIYGCDVAEHGCQVRGLSLKLFDGLEFTVFDFRRKKMNLDGSKVVCYEIDFYNDGRLSFNKDQCATVQIRQQAV